MSNVNVNDNPTGSKFGRNDPLRDFKFKVRIIPNDEELQRLTDGIGDLGFAVVSGIAVQNEMIPYREGGMNTHPHKMVGQSDFTPVTFSRGVFSGQDQLWKWQTFMHAWMQGGTGSEYSPVGNGGVSGGSKGTVTDYRCRIRVTVFDHPHTANGGSKYLMDPGNPVGHDPGVPRLQFTLFNAWPGGYALSDLNAGASSIMVQQMTVHHEGFRINWRPVKDED